MKSKIISGAIAITYLGGACFTNDFEILWRLAIFLVLPMACIWFSNAMGGYTGPNFYMRPAITKSTPSAVVAIGGWILLLTPAVILLIIYFSETG